MHNKLFHLSARVFGVIAFLASMGSTSFKCISVVSFLLAMCYFFIWSGDEQSYNHLRVRPFLSFNEKGEALYNAGWLGLFFLAVLLVRRFVWPF